MPKKLVDCVKKVMESGKDESSAWAICQKSTGLKPHKKKDKKAKVEQKEYDRASELPTSKWQGKKYLPEDYEGNKSIVPMEHPKGGGMDVSPKMDRRIRKRRKETLREHKDLRKSYINEELTMDKRAFEVTEDDLFESRNIVVSEDEVESPVILVEEDDNEKKEQPIQVGAWTSAPQFVRYCVASLHTGPQIKLTSVNSLRRAIAYYDNLEQEIAEGAAADAEHAELSMNQLETLDGVEEMVDAVRAHLYDATKRVGRAKKFASKSTLFTYYVDPFLFAVARIMINAKVANGKNIEDVFQKLASQYNIDDRETLALRQILRDMGYPIHGSFVADEGAYDMITQYYA